MLLERLGFKDKAFFKMNKTGFYTSNRCRLHEMGEGHPECPQRLDAIADRLLISGLDVALEMREAPMATEGDLLLAHDPLLVADLKRRAQSLSLDASFMSTPYAHIDPDTSMNVHTWDAAMSSVGGALAATNAVIDGDLGSAFCCVRPPGHHASRSQAMGFCFFNNVAIAVKHALDVRGLKRVAVVDFDVHHGNGTEDILAGDERVLMVSFFQHPFYPNTYLSPQPSNMLNVPLTAYTKGDEVKRVVLEQWLPRLEAHRPEMIFISAGFDAHRDDEMGQMLLKEEDYAWITQQVVAVAKKYANGRIVSSLEGGYDLRALGTSVEAHLRVLADC
jgi:acetoin utilization deacetylase AcuC-like enzyme